MKNVLYWLPRILSILYIALISMFALDIIGEPQWLLALFMHLIPSYFLIAVTVVAWKHETLGGFLFLLTGLAMLIFTHFEAFIIWIPALVIGLLFLMTKHLHKV
jgi:hypothetical protein